MKQTAALLASPLISPKLVLFYLLLLYLICAVSSHLFSCVNSYVGDTHWNKCSCRYLCRSGSGRKLEHSDLNFRMFQFHIQKLFVGVYINSDRQGHSWINKANQNVEYPLKIH